MRAVRTLGAAAAVLLMNANIIAPRESVESAARNELRTGQQASGKALWMMSYACADGICMDGTRLEPGPGSSAGITRK